MKKIISLLLALTLVFCFSSCGKAPDAKYVIGISAFRDHAAQAEVIEGFKDYLTSKLGDDVAFIEGSASGDASTATLNVTDLINKNVNLIMADTTQSLQTAVSATTTIPILGAAITDYASALNTKSNSNTTGINVSGTSDLAPLSKQADMITELFPTAKKVALLYCSSEANSLYQINAVQEHLAKKGITAVEYPFTDATVISASVEKACNECDVIYVPTDNTVAECAPVIRNIATPARIPVIAGEEGICKGCGVATLTIDYYELGKKTGEMAYKVLVEGADISKMPIETAETVTYKYNPEICNALGIQAPDGYDAIK